MRITRDLFIGSLFEIGNVYNEDGTAMGQAPHVTLHDRTRNKYYVANVCTADNGEYYVAFTKTVTTQIEEGLLDLEIYENTTMAKMLKFSPEYANARIVSSSPDQEEVTA